MSNILYTNQIPLKRREPRENQSILRYDNSGPLYSLEQCHFLDWKLFMWFASLEKVENYIYLFIVIWDTILVRINSEYLKEFEDETAILISNVKGLNVSIASDTNYCSILEDYKNSRFHNQGLRQSLIHNVWAELEGYGLKYYSIAVSEQLERCTIEQKRELRWMVLSRIKSFRSFARLIKEDKVKKQNEILIIKENSQQGNQELLRENEQLKAQIADLQNESSRQGNQELLRENERLKAQVASLIKENSQQQAALGNLTNVSWNDDDPNNTKKLNADITDLQDLLSDFTMVQGSDYKIIDEAAASLLKSSKCKAAYPSTKANLALGALLQKTAINTILEAARRYLDGPSENQDITLEREIVNTTKNLINYTNLFKDSRKGDDDITKVVPIKIRQHIYSSLSCRGLPSEHPLIKETANKLLDEMNRFRQVVDEETNDGLCDQAIQITHKVINIFCFRLKTQALEPTCQFFEVGQAVDARFMQGAFGREDYKKLEVEACGFPCISIFDGDNYKVFTKAEIVARQKKSES